VKDIEPRNPGGTEGARSSSYIGRVHLEVIAILLPIFLILVVVGWSMRPQSTGFSAVPTDALLTVQSADVVNGVSEMLYRTANNGAMLEVTVGAPWSEGAWSVEFYDLRGARLCTPSKLSEDTPDFSLLGPPIRVPPQHLKPAPQGYEVVNSTGPPSVWLCWSSNGPVQLNGPYLSAQFPGVAAESSSRGPFVDAPTTSVLYPNAGNTADFVIQSSATPTAVSADSWRWSANSTGAARLSAVSTSISQHQSFQAFLSGIALGLAGGALIAILSELVGPLSRSRDARHPV
jgi:hypothetical protein